MYPKLKSCNKKTEPIILNLNLDCKFDSDLCYKMVSGIIKHVLYHREQIPEPFDQLVKTCAKLEESKTEKVKDVAGARARQKENQLCKLGRTFSDLFIHLETIFFNMPNVRRLAIILGATPVTPRETHVIEIPVITYFDRIKSRSPLADLSTSCRYITQMFRTLYITSNAVVWPSISPTNVIVLVEMKRDSQVDWFVPKASYSLPDRGHKVVYKITATVPEVSAPTLDGQSCNNSTGCHTRNTKMDFDIYKSPQVKSLINKSVSTATDANCHSIINGICNISIAEAPIQTEAHDNENYIWFQMPSIAKGFGS